VIEGLTGLKRGLVMDVNPFVVGLATGAPAAEGTEGWVNDRSVEVGANVRWGMTPNLTLNGTVNPDFSQVESDASQTITDPRRALFFPEKRPFFLEGIEQFSTPNNLIYTRRVLAPVGAAKLTGKVSGTNLATMFALDDPATSADTTGGTRPLFAIARVQRDVGDQSKLGLVYTGRFDGGSTNQVGGADVRLVRGTWSLLAQGAGSLTHEAGENTTAPLWEVGLSRTGRHVGLNYSFEGVSDEFVAAAGFISRPGIVNLSLNHSYTFYGAPSSVLQRTTVSATLQGVWDYRDFVEGREVLDRQLPIRAGFALRGGWNLSATIFVERFGYDPDLYADYAVERRANGVPVDTVAFGPADAIDGRSLSLSLETPRLGAFSFRTHVIFGKDVNFFEWSPADVWLVNGSLGIRPTERIRFEGTYILQSYDRRTDASLVGITHIPRLRLEYQVSRAIFVRAVAEYNSAAQDSLRDDGRTNDPILILDPEDGVYKRELATASQLNRLRTEFLFSFQPVPGTVFFLGYNGGYTEEERFQFQGLERTADGFFLKASYLFRL
jgi:hypothetical protein